MATIIANSVDVVLEGGDKKQEERMDMHLESMDEERQRK